MTDKKISQLTDGSSPQSTDVFPIARSGANNGLTWAEMVAATPAANNDTVYVAAPTGTASTDNAAIANAISACPTGGCVQLQAGTYAIIDAATTSSLAISKKITLRGQGGADALWATYGTRLTVDHATAVGISISAHGIHIENLAVQNIHSTAPTAGAGIRTVTGGGNSTHYGPDLSVRGFYYNVDHQAGGEWFMDTSFFSYDFVYCGLRIQNVDNVDSGDAWISGQFVAGPVNNATACIQWLSGGGTKIIGAKLNTRNSKTCTIGIDMELQDGVGTSDFQVIGSSIENTNWGFLLEHAGPSNTGTFGNIVIQGCEFSTLGGASTQVIAVAPATTSKVTSVNIGGNIILGTSSQHGVEYKNINNATHGPNVFGTSLAGAFQDGGGNTNITSVGAG